MESFINLIPAGSYNNQKNNTGGNNGVVKNVCLSPTFVNNENKDCTSGESINLVNDRYRVMVRSMHLIPLVRLNVNELPAIVDNEVYEISNCESIRIINDVEKSLSGVEGRLHDEETNNRATNTEVAVTKNYHKYESYDSAKVNYSTNKLQKVSEDDCRKSTVRSNVSFPSKYQMRKSSNWWCATNLEGFNKQRDFRHVG